VHQEATTKGPTKLKLNNLFGIQYIQLFPFVTRLHQLKSILVNQLTNKMDAIPLD